MFNKLMNWLVPKLENWCEQTGRMRVITNLNSDEPYLVRYFLFYSKYCSIYIHRFLMSDHSVPHDHPFSFLGYIVSGEYIEETFHLPSRRSSNKPGESWWELDSDCHVTFAPRKQGTWAWRPANYTHVVHNTDDRKYNLDEKHKAPLTVIFRGPYMKNWGFWDIDKSRGFSIRQWIYHKTYLTGEEHVQEKPQDTEIEGAR
jgi:hypothetical protein